MIKTQDVKRVTVMIDRLQDFSMEEEGIENIYITENEGEPVKCTIVSQNGYRKVFPKKSIISYVYQP